MEKHDGKLDKNEYYRVDLEKNAYCPMYQDRISVVRVECKYSENMIKLAPTQALSLLTWLNQEQIALEALAKGEEASLSEVVIVSSRVYEQDIAGYVLEPGDWKHLNLPLEEEEATHGDD